MGQVLPELEAHEEQLLQRQPFPTVSPSHRDPKHSGRPGLGRPEHTYPLPGLGMKATVLPQLKASCSAAPLPCHAAGVLATITCLL